MAESHPPKTAARHLRLVPPLDDDGAIDMQSDAPLTLPTAAFALPLGAPPKWLTATFWGAAALILAAGWAAWGSSVRSSHGPQKAGRRPQSAQHGAPSFQLYARNRGADDPFVQLGRLLSQGDVLRSDDELVLGIHNAPGPGLEAARYVAVFVIDAAHNIAPLYPAGSADAWAMPLPEMAFMAFMGGPKVQNPVGPVTFVAVFLRRPMPLGALMAALPAAAPKTTGEPWAFGAALTDNLVHLQEHTFACAQPRMASP